MWDFIQTVDKYSKKFMGLKVNNDPNISGVKRKSKSDEINSNLVVKFFEVSDTKVGIINEINDIINFFFSQMIIERIIDDSLSPSVRGSEIFNISISDSEGNEDESLTNLVNDFSNNFNLHKLILDVSYDMLAYGEYYLRLDTIPYQSKDTYNNFGIVNIHDDVEIADITPIFKDGEINYYLQNTKDGLKRIQPSQYVYFGMSSNRIKVKVHGNDDKILYFRMGKSILYPVLGLLKELRLLENMLPITFVNQFLKTDLVSVSVPSTTKPQDALEAAKMYEKMINETLQINVNNKKEDEILKVLSSRMGKVKVIPNWGDKGGLNREEFQDDQKYDAVFEKINDLRKMILMTIGLPPNLIGEDESLKGENLKNYVRYMKKIKLVQQAISDGIKRMIMIHLTNSGYSYVSKDDIHVTFLNSINVDDIEQLEMIDLSAVMIENFLDFINKVSSDVEGITVNKQKVLEFLNKYIENTVGMSFFELQEENKDDTKGGGW